MQLVRRRQQDLVWVRGEGEGEGEGGVRGEGKERVGVGNQGLDLGRDNWSSTWVRFGPDFAHRGAHLGSGVSSA